jgi:NAD(P)-dependent dehydrogenase (short-subunit alcohol dehydrogenase family)
MYSNYFQNKIALVTGGGSGIGRGVCLALVKAGATVICTDINKALAAETASLAGHGAKIVAHALDVTQPADVEAALNGVVERYGRLDLVFNNAGIGMTGELRDLSLEDWHKLMNINFYGVLHGAQSAYQIMLKQGSGQIVNTASAAGLIDYLVLLAPYAVSKHAVVAYNRILRLEAKEFGIKVNVICPGVVSTSIINNGSIINSGADHRTFMQEVISKGVSIENAANSILKGVAANRETILFPGKMKFVLGLVNTSGWLLKVAMGKMLNDFRKKYRE